MKACEALIAWTPKDYSSFNSGSVCVGKLLKKGEYDWTKEYEFTGGASFKETRELTGADSVAKVFIEYHTMVLRDRISPEVAHRAFLVIDEYREYISADIEGSTMIERIT